MGTLKKINNKVQLSLEERVALSINLPQQGSYEKLIVVKELLTKLTPTTDEVQKFEIVSTPTQMGWNAKGKTAKFDYEFKELEKLAIKDALNKLNKEEKLIPSLIGLYKQFCL